MSNKKLRVEGMDHLYRTPEGAIVNTDKNAYNSYMRKKQSLKAKDETLGALAEQLEVAKSEIEELKSLIKQLIHK